MQVELYHNILIWPLKMEPSAKWPENWIDELEKFVKTGSVWQSVGDPYLADDDSHEVELNPELSRYAEFVYFHPFVQELLFAKVPSHGFRTLRRDDVKKMRVKMDYGEHLLDVLRVRLYLVSTGIVLLVVEIRGHSINLHELEDLADSIRRSYPPFWKDGLQAGLCPREVTWLDSAGNALAASDYQDVAAHIRPVREHRHPPVSSHWQWLLAPLAADGPGRWQYRHIEDERIPSMCYFSFSDPTKLTDGDFFRLGLLDARGRSASLPYAASCFQDFVKQSCYDRFWDPKTPGHEWMRTRYLCTGFSFVMIERMDPAFYANAEGGALAHFRHHYFHLGLIGQLQKASLLVFSGRLAESGRDSTGAGDWERRYEKISRLVSDIADFTGRFWFTELSNQLQGRELFNLWAGHMDTHKLFQHVMDSAQFVSQYLADEQRERQTRATLMLTKVGAYGVPLTVMVAIGLVAGQEIVNATHCWWKFIGAVLLSILAGLGFGWLVEKIFVEEKRERGVRS